MDLFVYGTLLFPEVLTALLRRVPASRPASAVGWRVAALPARPYPGLVPHPGGRASGLVISGLDATETRLLDDYEHGGYERTEITLSDGRRCATYVWRGQALPAGWQPDAFAAQHLDAYARQCTRWRATWPVSSSTTTPPSGGT